MAEKKKKQQELSIESSMVKSIVLFVMLPLFLALIVLGVLLQRSSSQGIAEAYQMMFDQSVREIDGAILQSNYVSSTMITYTENNRLLKNYYEEKTAYQKSVAADHLRGMILNCNVSNLGSFGGEMILLMNDGRLISSEKTVKVSDGLYEQQWYGSMENNGSNPYWDSEITNLFDRSGKNGYVAYGRALTRYQERTYGYALMILPDNLFKRSVNDQKGYQGGVIAMFSPDGRLLTDGNEEFSEDEIRERYRQWTEKGRKSGAYGSDYVLGTQLSSCGNAILYIGDRHRIFERSEMIFAYLGCFMAVCTLLLVHIVISISRYITAPILFFAEKISSIEQLKPEELTLNGNHFQETKALEQGMVRAQKRIRILMEEVRQETVMKEKARFDALKAQINPHFLFNTLNAIRWKASINGDREVEEILMNLSVLLGETYKNDEELETIGNSIYTLEAYAKIMQVRFGNNVDFISVVPDSLREYLIPRFCLQPLLENSFIHGMSHAENGVIALRGEMADDDVELTLIDNGTGLQGKVLDLSDDGDSKQRGITGIGLPNIHKRIRMLYGDHYGLVVDTEVDLGFKITLRIPAMKRGTKADESTDSGR